MSKNTKRQNKNDKKSTVLQPKKQGLSPLSITLGALVIIGAVAIGFFITQNTGSQINAPTVASASGNEINHPLSKFEDGSAQHFDYKADGLTIRYFIIKSGDGVIRAAFDACDVCWPAGKGYYQEGNNMVCRNCGRKFASELVNEVQGGCNPAPLNRRVEGDRLVLKIEDILKGKSYFNFKGKA